MATFAYTPRAMNTRSLIISGLSVALLVGCGGPVSMQYRLTFDVQDPEHVELLTKSTVRVIQRRLDRLGAQLYAQQTIQDPDGATLELSISDAAAAEALSQEMTAPFDLQIMRQTTGSGDITVEGFGTFMKTGVTGDDIELVASLLQDDGTATVQIKLTDEGQKEMATLFKENVGKDLGLFVRGKLVSALTIRSAELPNPLSIDGVPDLELANTFADDVNVGIHVTVTPL